MDLFGVVKVVAGSLIAASVTAQIVRTLVIPRARRTLLGQVLDVGVDRLFQALAKPFGEYERKDQILAAQGAVFLMVQLIAWLMVYELAFSLVLWSTLHNFPAALREVASSMFTLGFIYTGGSGAAAVDVLAAAMGLIVVALQIAYLPTLYSAFSRREAEVMLLAARAGAPAWGPELLLRTRYGIASRTDDLQALYDRWERWAADIAESHSNYPVLVRFRSPQPLMSWMIALLAVMDSAAMWLAVAPEHESVEARRAIRMGFTALRQIGTAIGLPVDLDPDPDGQIQLSFDDYSAAWQRLAEVGFPVERSAEESWPHFRGWRVNYEPLAYALASRTDAVPAPWSGPRRWPAETIGVQRPPNRRPGGASPVVPGEPGKPEEPGKPGEPGKAAAATTGGR